MIQDVSVIEVLSQNDSMLREFFAKLVRGELGFHDHHIYWDRDNNTLFSSPNNLRGELVPATVSWVNVFNAARGDQTYMEFGGDAEDVTVYRAFDMFLSRVEEKMYSATLQDN